MVLKPVGYRDLPIYLVSRYTSTSKFKEINLLGLTKFVFLVVPLQLPPVVARISVFNSQKLEHACSNELIDAF